MSERLDAAVLRYRAALTAAREARDALEAAEAEVARLEHALVDAEKAYGDARRELQEAALVDD